MNLVIRIELDDGESAPLVIGRIERNGPVQAGTLGLTLAESKSLLYGLQEVLVQRQLKSCCEAQRRCPHCGARRALKDYHAACFKSLFGNIVLRVPRIQGCRCKGPLVRPRSVQVDGLKGWVSPELDYVHNQLAATLPYARTVQLLTLLLPVEAGNTVASARRRVLTAGQRLDAELQHPKRDDMPAATEPATAVGLDSGYLRHCCPSGERNFEVVVGRILSPGHRARSVGFVRTLENNAEARHRLQQRLHERGAPSDDLTVFTDGDSGLRWLLPEASHILDWYHLTRYLTVMQQVLYGRDALDQFPGVIHDLLCKWLTSMKWRLWHGRVSGALQRLASMLFTLKRRGVARKRAALRLRRLSSKLQRYLKNNANSIPNYGKRYRSGQRISTAFVESAVNQLIDKRMSKSQQMRWSPEGAHALLQVRAEVVDERLGAAFTRWYPGFVPQNDTMPLAA
jgi:hypothetical protein